MMSFGRLFAALLALGLALSACSSPPTPQVGDACARLDDCLGGNNLVCNEGTCSVVGCQVPGDCPLNTTCIDTVCRPPECEDNADCANDALCWQGICAEDGCIYKTECADGLVCLGAPPTCTEPPELCSSTKECPMGSDCLVSERRCTPICTDDADCTGADYCLEGLCSPPCRDDGECPGERSCVEGRCEELPDCSGARECSGLQPYRDPLTCECASCLANTDCDLSRQEVCSSQRACLFCPEPGNSESDCAVRGMIYIDGCCTECQQDADCPGDARPYCERGRCVSVASPECVSKSDCEGEQICDRGQCVEPPSLQSCQTQSDCPAGEACYADGRCHAEADVCDDCPPTSRCVAEPGDEVGTCAGCTAHCDAAACPDGQVCFVPDGAPAGYCVSTSASGC